MHNIDAIKKNNVSDIETKMNKSDQFYALILKITNLLIISTISGIIMSLLIYVVNIGQYWSTLEHTMNVLCIYLSFGGFNDKTYQKLCFMERLCYKCCAKICFCCCLPSNLTNKSTSSTLQIADNKTDTNDTNDAHTPQSEINSI